MITSIKQLKNDEGEDEDVLTLQLVVKLSKSGYQANVMTIHGKGRWGTELPFKINGRPLECNYQFGTKPVK